MAEFLRIEPPASRYKEEDVVVVDLTAFPIDTLELAARLRCGESMTLEDLDNEALASEEDPGTEKGREEALNRIHSENAQRLVELLNFVLHVSGKEVSESSVFSVLELEQCPTCTRLVAPEEFDNYHGECNDCHENAH